MGEDRYGGGRSKTTKSLTITMKKVQKSGNKMGIIGPKGAKSRIGKGIKKKLQNSDSSQMVIGDYFSRKVGIIEPGFANNGRIPMGNEQDPIRT